MHPRRTVEETTTTELNRGENWKEEQRLDKDKQWESKTDLGEQKWDKGERVEVKTGAGGVGLKPSMKAADYKFEAAPVIRETVHPVENIEIQPVIHRQREQVELRQIIQPVIERRTNDMVTESVLPEVRKEAPSISHDLVRKQFDAARQDLRGSFVTEQLVRHQFEKPAIVENDIKKTIVFEETIPVIEKHITEKKLIKQTLPIYEKFVDEPVLFREVKPTIERGATFGGTTGGLRQEQQLGGFREGGLRQGGLGAEGGLGKEGFREGGLRQEGLGGTQYQQEQKFQQPLQAEGQQFEKFQQPTEMKKGEAYHIPVMGGGGGGLGGGMGGGYMKPIVITVDRTEAAL